MILVKNRLPISKREKQIERDVRKYVMTIEEAHKKAAKSKLRFD